MSKLCNRTHAVFTIAVVPLLQRAGQYKLLTADQEKELAREIQQLVQLKSVSEAMAAETSVQPSAVEVAEKAGITPAEYQVRLRLCITKHIVQREGASRRIARARSAACATTVLDNIVSCFE